MTTPDINIANYGDKRITPEETVAAYRGWDLKPVQSDYLSDNRASRLCGCPITALYFEANGGPCDVHSAAMILWADATYGTAYHQGFTMGVDEYPLDQVADRLRNSKRWQQGYLDGAAAWAAVQKELLGAGT